MNFVSEIPRAKISFLRNLVTFHNPLYSAQIVSGWLSLRKSNRIDRLTAELTERYPESDQLSFSKTNATATIHGNSACSENLSPRIRELESHLKEMGNTIALLAHPLVELMTYVEERKTALDRKPVANNLADVAKAMIIGTHKTKAARMELNRSSTLHPDPRLTCKQKSQNVEATIRCGSTCTAVLSHPESR